MAHFYISVYISALKMAAYCVTFCYASMDI